MDISSDNEAPSSMWMIRAAELFPKPVLEKEDDSLTVPFSELAGESVKHLGRWDDGILALSNYRLFILKHSNPSEISIPLGLIESVQIKELFQIIINCKDASVFKCSFLTSDVCSEWNRRLNLATGIPGVLEALFAFPFHAWVSELPPTTDTEWYGRLQRATDYDTDFRKEISRLNFDLQGAWRISYTNVDFKLCNSYPKMLVVPACISDDTLLNVASFRSSRRIPAVVWRHKTGAVIARCSQPEVGWLGWRNSKDEQLLKALSDACAFDNGEPNSKSRTKSLTDKSSDNSVPSSPEGSHEEVGASLEEPKKILIVDARSYTSAVTNRARGGGCECPEYYPSAEIQFMSLGNIHAIRKSFHALRQLCASPSDIANWFSLLERTLWLQHMSGLLTASVVVCHAIEKNNRPVLVHCSDGWDRTPQIVATAQLCLDPYYRTVEGFRVLIEKEWLSFGHKFGDRVGHGVGSDETNERCPVFLQWIDCVHQIHRQFPCSFEFSMGYLIKLAQHAHSCLFGTFLCNTVKERLENSIPDRTFSVWPFLSGPMYKNPLYMANRDRVLWPAHNVRDLALWGDVYLGSLRNHNTSIDYPNTVTTNGNGELSLENGGAMVKTRSYNDLVLGLSSNGLIRRSSDPNMMAEPNLLTTPLNISIENSIDSNESTNNYINTALLNNNMMSSLIQDTTQKLQILTQELNEDVMDLPEIRDWHAENGLNGVNDANDDSQSQENGDKEHEENGIPIINGDMVDGFKDKSMSEPSSFTQNFWHGSVDTSTDTLVPIEHMQERQERQERQEKQEDQQERHRAIEVRHDVGSLTESSAELIQSELSDEKCDTVDSIENGFKESYPSKMLSNMASDLSSSRFKQLPDVHISRSTNAVTTKTKMNGTSAPKTPHDDSIQFPELNAAPPTNQPTSSFNHHNQFKPIQTRCRNLSTSRTEASLSPATDSMSTPGVLPLTPPGLLLERSAGVLSFPDGLAPAISEPNLRLQQIIYENKLREEALQQELYATRLALLKKTTCCNCNQNNNAHAEAADEMPSLLDSNIENSSNCSWEAVDSQSGASSNSPLLIGSVLWVPDHCVTRCTDCQIQFWLGLRKHHCRACGQIFCSDCSEFWAPLPDEKLFHPVRLCASCFESVSDKLQQQHIHLMSSSQRQSESNYANNNMANGSNGINGTMTASAPARSSLEKCKQVVQTVATTTVTN